MVVGFNLLRFARNAEFKGRGFCCSDQAVWSFDKAGGGYTGEAVRLTADRLVTAKGAAQMAEAIKVAEESAK